MYCTDRFCTDVDMMAIPGKANLLNQHNAKLQYFLGPDQEVMFLKKIKNLHTCFGHKDRFKTD